MSFKIIRNRKLCRKLSVMFWMMLASCVICGTTVLAAEQQTIEFDFTQAVTYPQAVVQAYGISHLDSMTIGGTYYPAWDIPVAFETYNDTLTLVSGSTTWGGLDGWTHFKGSPHSYRYTNSNRIKVFKAVGCASDTYWEFQIPSANEGDIISFGNVRIYLGEEFTDNLGNSSLVTGFPTFEFCIICEDGTEDSLGTVNAGAGANGTYASYYLGAFENYTVTAKGASKMRIKNALGSGSINWESDTQQAVLNCYFKAEGQVKVAPPDTEGPTLTVSGNPTSWVSGATITATATDESGLASAPYSWDGGTSWTAVNTCTVSENGTITVYAKDVLGNISSETITVSYIDRTSPTITSVTGEGTASSYAQARTITINAADDGAGLNAYGAYCFDGTNWTTENSYTYTGTLSTVVIKVRDSLENYTQRTVAVYTDNSPPMIHSVTGNPASWQNTPCTVTVTAEDTTSGLHEMAYNFNNEGWGSSNTYEVSNNMTLNIVVKDKAGNQAERNYPVTMVDTEKPTLSVSYLALSEDHNFVVTELAGTDTGSGNVEFCFNFDELNPETAVWQSEKIESLAVGSQVTVACKDAAGNIAKQTIRPTEYSVTAGGGAGGGATGNLPIFTQNVLNCAGYTLGGGDTATKYMRETGTTADYTTYSAGGTSVTGLAVNISAAPTRGGILSGYAEISGQRFPIYWDASHTQVDSDVGGTGTFIIDKSKLRVSSRNTSIAVRIDEYEDNTKTRIINTETIRDTISIDATAPVVSIYFNAATAKIDVSVRDTTGVDTANYAIKDESGSTIASGLDYTTSYTVTQRCRAEVTATDKLGNTVTKLSNVVEPSAGAGGAPAGGNYPSYRTYYFDYYVEGA